MANADPKADEDLGLALLNINSLRNKVPDIFHILTHHKIHVLALTETKLDGSIENFELNIEHYNFYRKDRKTGRGGGVGLYIQNQILVKERPDFDESDLEMIWVEIYLPHAKPLLVGCCYRQKETNIARFDNICRKLTDVSNDKDIFLLGDFNIDWLTDKNKFVGWGMTQIVKVPTRVAKSKSGNTSSCIDHIYTNIHERCSEPTSVDTSCSDHKLITVTVQQHVLKGEDTVIQRSYRTFDKDKFIGDINRGSWSDVQKEFEPEEALSKFTATFRSIADKHAPLKRYTTKNDSAPWWGHDLTDLIQQRDHAKTTAFVSDRQEEMEVNRERKEYGELKKLILTKFQDRKLKYIKQNFRTVNTDRKKLEKLLKDFNQRTSNTPVIQTESVEVNGPTETDKLSAFVQFYADKVEQLKPQHHHHEGRPLSNIDNEIMQSKQCSLSFRSVTDKDVEKLLLSLRVSVTPGTDEIDAFLLKTAAPYISATICHILNICIHHSKFPSQWKESKIIPECRSADFRHETVLPVLSQILEKVLVQQMEEYFTENKLFINPHTLDDMTHQWLTGLKDNKHVGAVFMDFSSSYDVISPDQLLDKLKSYNFSQSAVSMMRSFLSDRKQKLFYNGFSSPQTQNNGGLPRGSCLAYFLFFVYTNDIKVFVPESSIVMCDHYLIIYHSADNDEDLNNQLAVKSEHVEGWIKDNNMVLNQSKQKIITTESRFCDTHDLLRSIEDILQDQPLSWSKHFN